MRIGFGYDAHRFATGRKLVLGGVTIPYDKGLLAHSDGDVLIHALCDAMLGAAGSGDIGQHFPDNRDEFAGIDSRILLRQVVDKITEKNLTVSNLDITVVAQAPKLAVHIPAIRENLSKDLKTNNDQINIKATTTEGMGFAGRGEGIACYAVVLLE